MDPLSRLHPVIVQWFRDRYQRPTDIQFKAWVTIQARRHVLITAPTGSGKTLAAFLWAINELITAKAPAPLGGNTRVL